MNWIRGNIGILVAPGLTKCRYVHLVLGLFGSRVVPTFRIINVSLFLFRKMHVDMKNIIKKIDKHNNISKKKQQKVESNKDKIRCAIHFFFYFYFF